MGKITEIERVLYRFVAKESGTANLEQRLTRWVNNEKINAIYLRELIRTCMIPYDMQLDKVLIYIVYHLGSDPSVTARLYQFHETWIVEYPATKNQLITNTCNKYRKYSELLEMKVEGYDEKTRE